mmetsp:Transcript_359/g.811  ORF Transcript_359/g.811 Transcript_359/m.811 type:complete len:377 (-) Transcript_359:1100-2230(-)
MNGDGNAAQGSADVSSVDRSDDVKSRIRAIALDMTLSPEERTKRIQEVYTSLRKPSSEPSTVSEEVNGVELKMGTPLGLGECTHYKRHCSIVSKCCGKVFPCRLCHDEVADHKIDRFATEIMVCRECKLSQEIADKCKNPECSWESTSYCCTTCRLWIDGGPKAIFHCEGCGICRVGKREDYIHCDACKLCLPPSVYEEHTCVDSSRECVVCYERLYDSTASVVLLKCGHALHSGCHRQRMRSDILTCPSCRVSMLDDESLREVTNYIRNAVAQQPMPPEFQNVTANIHCDDCRKKSDVPFHFLGHICTHCESPNTVVLSRTSPSRPINEILESLTPGQANPNPLEAFISVSGLDFGGNDDDDDDDDDDDKDGHQI